MRLSNAILLFSVKLIALILLGVEDTGFGDDDDTGEGTERGGNDAAFPEPGETARLNLPAAEVVGLSCAKAGCLRWGGGAL